MYPFFWHCTIAIGHHQDDCEGQHLQKRLIRLPELGSLVPGAIVFPSYCVTYDDDGRPLPCEVSILCSWCSCPRICSQQAAPGREIPDKILAKLGAEICGCKKQGNVNTTHESYGLEVKQREGRRGCLGKTWSRLKRCGRQKSRDRGVQRTIGPPDNVLCIFL